MDIGTLGVDALPMDCDTARPNGPAIGGGFAFGVFIEQAPGRHWLESRLVPFAPGGFYWRVGPRVSRSSAPGPAR